MHEREHGINENEGDPPKIAVRFRDSSLAPTPRSGRIDIDKHVSTHFDEAVRTPEYILDTESQRGSTAESSVRGKAKATFRRFFPKSKNKENKDAKTQ